MKHPSFSQSARLFALGAALCSVASASVVSWNFDNNGTLTPANVAGVVPVANWSNSWPSNPTTDLVDDSGSATTLDLAYQSFNQWSITGSGPGMDADGTFNRNLLNGYLNSGNAGWGPSITYSRVELTQIPFGQYDVIVYFSSDVAGREGTVTDGTSTYSFNSVGPASVSGASALFVETNDLGGSYATIANYAIFSGLSGSAQAFTVQMRDNDEWGGIAGFQLVSVPEPATTAALMGGAGLAFVVGLRRRRR